MGKIHKPKFYVTWIISLFINIDLMIFVSMKNHKTLITSMFINE